MPDEGARGSPARGVDRRVAVDVLAADIAAMLGAQRFFHEIRVTAQLPRPHVLGSSTPGSSGPRRNR